MKLLLTKPRSQAILDASLQSKQEKVHCRLEFIKHNQHFLLVLLNVTGHAQLFIFSPNSNIILYGQHGWISGKKLLLQPQLVTFLTKQLLHGSLLFVNVRADTAVAPKKECTTNATEIFSELTHSTLSFKCFFLTKPYT